MADRYWNPSGAANTNDINSWAASDGGATGETIPTSADNVFFTSTNVNNCTVNAAFACADLSFTGGTGYTGTFAGSSAMSIYGSLTLNAAMNRTYTGAITFAATSTGKTITMNTETLSNANITFNGVGGGWTLQDAFNVGSATITVTNGTLDTNGQTCTWGPFNSASGSGTRTITLGASAINMSGDWSVSTAGTLTLNANTSVITLSGNSANFTGGGQTYSGLFFTGVSTSTVGGDNTFTNLSKTGVNIGAVLSFTGNQTITGTFTVTGASGIQTLVQGNTFGTARTITAAAVSFTNANFRDITAAGAASPFTGTLLGDCGGNTNITTTTPVTRYWVGNGGNLSDTTHWSATTGGAGSASVPLPQDTANFDANSFSSGSQVVTNNVRYWPAINFTNVSNTPDFSFNAGTTHFFGSITLVAGMTVSSYFNAATFSNRSGTLTLTLGGKTLAGGFTINAPGGTVSLADNADFGTASVTLTAGTLDVNGDVVMSSFSQSGSATRGLTMGSGTWTLSSNFTNTVTSGMTFNAETSTLVLTGTTKTISLGAKTYNVVTFTGDNLTISGSATYGTMNVNNAGQATGLKFTAGTTTTITTAFTTNGTAGSKAKILSTTGSPFILSKASGTVAVDGMDITNSTAQGGATWNATNSTDGGGNTGWNFLISAAASSSPQRLGRKYKHLKNP